MSIVPKPTSQRWAFWISVATFLIGLFLYVVAWLWARASNSADTDVLAAIGAMFGLGLSIFSLLIMLGIGFYKRYGRRNDVNKIE